MYTSRTGESLFSTECRISKKKGLPEYGILLPESFLLRKLLKGTSSWMYQMELARDSIAVKRLKPAHPADESSIGNQQIRIQSRLSV